MATTPVSNHIVHIMARGGKQKIAALLDVTNVQWGRVRDDISQAQITISVPPDSAQKDLLASLEAGWHEIKIWRGDDNVWEGPITLLTLTRDQAILNARDVLHYAERCALSRVYDNSFPHVGSAVERVRLILATELGDLETPTTNTPAINVVPYITAYEFGTDAQTSAKNFAYETDVWSHMDQLAQYGGIDYTVVGRAIHIWDTNRSVMGQTQVVTESDFLGDVTISAYGMQLVTRSIVTDGQGSYGIAGGTDSYYGRVDQVANPYNQDAQTTPTSAELLSQADRNLNGNNPTPLQVRIPDGSSVNMDGVLSINDLVGGVYIPLLANLNVRKISQMQKLSQMQVTEDGETGETITVTLFPAAESESS